MSSYMQTVKANHDMVMSVLDDKRKLEWYQEVWPSVIKMLTVYEELIDRVEGLSSEPPTLRELAQPNQERE